MFAEKANLTKIQTPFEYDRFLEEITTGQFFGRENWYNVLLGFKLKDKVLAG